MTLSNRLRASAPKGEGPRKFAFELSMSGLVSVALVGVLGLAWVFILGILVGRGYKPENAVPELARIMPAPAEVPAKPAEPPTVLKPEELQFMENLGSKGKPGEPVVVDSAKGASDSTLAKYAAPETGDKGKPALQGKPAEGPPGKGAPDKPAPDKALGDKVKRYAVTYQIGAFADKIQAQSEIDRLAKRGQKITLSEAKANGKVLYRLMIQVKGTEDEIRDVLAKMGQKNPILREKKPL